MITKRCTVADSGDPVRGRIVLAAEDLPPGTLVLDEHPLAFCLNPAYWTSRCNFCFKRSDELKQCTRCKSQWFCGDACFRKAWKRFHKTECKPLRDQTLQQAGISDAASQCDALLLSRISTPSPLNNPHPQTNPARSQPFPHAFTDLPVPPSLLRNDANIRQLSNQIISLTTSSTSSTTQAEEEDMTDALYKFRCNNFGIMDILLSTVGAGVYPAAAKLNHSCQPNCCLSYHEGTRLKIHTTSRVAKGEELCHAYIDIAETTSFRQRKLRDTYGFRCTCTLCKQPRLVKPMPGMKHDDRVDLDDAFHACDAAMEQQKEVEVVRRLQDSVASVDDPVEELSVLILQLSMLTGNWQVSETHCDVICQAYARIYGDTHPLLGLQLLTLGDINFTKTHCTARGISLLNRAQTILTNACGAEAEIVQVVSSMLQTL